MILSRGQDPQSETPSGKKAKGGQSQNFSGAENLGEVCLSCCSVSPLSTYFFWLSDMDRRKLLTDS